MPQHHQHGSHADDSGLSAAVAVVETIEHVADMRGRLALNPSGTRPTIWGFLLMKGALACRENPRPRSRDALLYSPLPYRLPIAVEEEMARVIVVNRQVDEL